MIDSNRSSVAYTHPRALIRLISMVINEITAHFPNFAEFLAIVVSVLKVVHIQKRVVFVVRLRRFVWVQGGAKGQGFKDGIHCRVAC